MVQENDTDDWNRFMKLFTKSLDLCRCTKTGLLVACLYVHNKFHIVSSMVTDSIVKSWGTFFEDSEKLHNNQ